MLYDLNSATFHLCDYFKVLKPNQARKGGTTTNLDEFDFDEDDDDFFGGNAEYINTAETEEQEYEASEPHDLDTPAEEYTDAYTYETHVSNIESPEDEDNQ